MKRLVKAYIHIERAEDIAIYLEADVTKEDGRFYWNSIKQDKPIELSPLEYARAEDAIQDAAINYWDSFTQI